MEGVAGAESAWVADECNRVPGQGLSPGEEGKHAEFVEAANFKEFDARQEFGVLRAEKRSQCIEAD